MLPHDLCSHVQNAFRARHAKIFVEHNTQNLGILSILLRAGFISNITRGTITSPDPIAFHNVPEPQQRIWADLKYRNDIPVLKNMELGLLSFFTLYFHIIQKNIKTDASALSTNILV
ncbi:mitochondrial ribosomal protein subunit s8 [Lentinula edodes]|uniref:Mitochondrial ribosomal protein subunit s8 n=1 Tax=Lentinula edodes TaxID=5353 RepID=A0A1Q3EPL3_LENED|nr:mitochondrial ribosomal protein subunit s8 [Lentinula edodes]